MNNFRIIFPAILLGMWVCLVGCEQLINIKPVPAKGFMKFYGGVEDQAGTDMKPTPDGGYILLGSTASFSGNGNSDFFLVKADSLGNADWTLFLGGPNPDSGRAVILTPSVGGYAVIGDYGTNAAGDSSKIFMAKISDTGEITWQGILSETLPGVETASTLELLPDGSGYILIGTTSRVDTTKNGWNPVTDLKDIYVARLGPLATPQITFEQQHGFAGVDEGVGIRPFPDGTYDILGNTKIPNENHTDILFSKISKDGLPLISTKIIGGPENDRARSLTVDGTGYLVAGSSMLGGVKRFYWARTDDQGNTTQEFTHQVTPMLEDELSNVLPLGTGFIIAGNTLISPRSGRDFYLAEMDANGAVVWETWLGAESDDDFMGRVLPADGGYVFVGTSGFSNNTSLTLTKVNLLGQL